MDTEPISAPTKTLKITKTVLEATDNIATRSLRCWMDANDKSPCFIFFEHITTAGEFTIFFDPDNAGNRFASGENCDTQPP